MTTEFEISIRFACWGDKLNPGMLADELGLNLEFSTLRSKGDNKKRLNRDGLLGVEKTGM